MNKVILLVILLIPLPALTETIVVSLGKYNVVLDENESPKNAQLIADRVTESLIKQKWTAITTTRLCEDKACISSLAKSEKTDEGIFVHTKQTGGKYEFTIVTATGKSYHGDITASLTKALNLLDRLVLQAIKAYHVQNQKTRIAPTSLPSKPNIEISVTQNSFLAPSGRKKLEPIYFWLAASTTLAMGAALLVLESQFLTTYNGLKDQPPDDRSASRINDLEAMQSGARILFIGTMVGLTATTVLGFVTDFRARKKDKIAILPMWSRQMSAVVLQGQF